jgi:hypothetical protein
VFFTIQPGGGFIDTPNAAWPAGARVVYPNYTGARPGTELNFWNYDPEKRGWHIYGGGVVDAMGRQVVPKPGTVIYRFTGTMIIVQGLNPPGDGPLFGGQSCCDPVDLATGLFVLEKTDLYLSDVVPLNLRRTYRPNDTDSRPFGIGSTHPYAMFLWSAQQYQEADMILPDGGRIHYVRTSGGTGFTDAAFEHKAVPPVLQVDAGGHGGGGSDAQRRDGKSGVRTTRSWRSVTMRYRSRTQRRPKVTKAIAEQTFIGCHDTSDRITQPRTTSTNGGYQLWKRPAVKQPAPIASLLCDTAPDAHHQGSWLITCDGQSDTNGRVTQQTRLVSATWLPTLDGSAA